MCSKGLIVLTSIIAYSPAYGQVKVVAKYNDTNGNGLVDTNEFVYQANSHLDAIIRMNSTGFLIGDGGAIRADMIAYVKSMFGDLNGDGVVTWDDMLSQIANLGPVSSVAPKILQGDLNLDGVVDGVDVQLMFLATGTTTTVDDAFALALWGQIIGMSTDTGYQSTLSELLIDQNAQSSGGHRGPNDHNQAITSTWPPPPPVFPYQEWDWPSDHLGTVSSTWYDDSWDGTWPAPSSPDYPANHHGGISATWGGSSEGYWPPNHDVARSSGWNSDGLHQAMTSSTWPPSHLIENSIAGIEDDTHVQVISYQNTGHNQDTSNNANWPPNHLRHISRTWNTDHDEATSSAWPANHIMVISNSWSNPNPGWPANHYEIISLRDSQPGDHDWRVTLMTLPTNPFHLPTEILGSMDLGIDLVSLLDLN